MELNSLKNIPDTFSFVRKALLVSCIISLISILGSVGTSIFISQKYMKTIYAVKEDGNAFKLESISNNDSGRYKKIEITNHIKVFHKLFYEIDQFSYEKRINESLYLIGNTGKDLYKTLKYKEHYSNIVANNLVHKLEIDSIKVDESRYPYRGEFFGKINIERTDSKKEQINQLHAVFTLQDVSRNLNNPHGLLIENYIVKIN